MASFHGSMTTGRTISPTSERRPNARTRADYLADIREAAQRQDADGERREAEIVELDDELSSHELETEDDVEAFVGDLREKLLARVRNDKIVIIK